MSESDASEADRDREQPVYEEILDGEPVLAGPPRIVPVQAAPEALSPQRQQGAAVIPAVQAAAVAAGGFVAGAALVGLVHRRRRRSSALVKGRRARRGISGSGASRREGRAGELLQIVGSRSLLLDVHLLGGTSGDR